MPGRLSHSGEAAPTTVKGNIINKDRFTPGIRRPAEMPLRKTIAHHHHGRRAGMVVINSEQPSRCRKNTETMEIILRVKPQRSSAVRQETK